MQDHEHCYNSDRLQSLDYKDVQSGIPVFTFHSLVATLPITMVSSSSSITTIVQPTNISELISLGVAWVVCEVSAQVCIKRGASFLVSLLAVSLMHVSRLTVFATIGTTNQAVVTFAESE